jgi:hypothetical protein
MARFSRTFLQGLLEPTYQQGLFEAARGVGQTPGIMRMQREEEEQKKRKRQIAGLVASGQQMEDQAKALATQRRKNLLTKQAIQLAQRDGDTKAIQAIGLGALDPATYLSSRATESPKKTEYNYSEETIIGENGKPLRVQVGVSKTDPSDRVITPIGPAVPTGGKAETKTLEQQLSDAGVPAVDLTTLSGAQQARRDIIEITGDASLANSVGRIIEDLTPMSVKEGLDLVRSTNPEFIEAERLRELTSRFTTLENLAEEDIAGLSALIERTLTATTENDIKAVAELERFRKAKDLPQRIEDFALELTTGRLSDDTIKEYSILASAFEELAEVRMTRALDNLIVYGNAKESDAAQRAKNMILGESKARIVP